MTNSNLSTNSQGINAQALDGLKVLDLSRVLAGPWCSQMLADLGADVIKIERPGKGDDTRGWGPPYVENEAGEPVESAYFLSTNRGKRSLAIDISAQQGQEVIRSLAQKADVIIENFKVGGLKKYSLDYESLKADNPGLIYCSITGFGQDGPYAESPGYDFMIQGLGGLMHITGQADSQPVKVGVAVADIMTGMYASVAILAALNHRQVSGEGQYIDLALLDCQVAMLANQASNYLTSGVSPGRLGNAHPNIVPYQVVQTSDGFIIIAVGNDTQFSRFCELLNLAEISTDEKFSTNKARVTNRSELVGLMQPVIQNYTSEYWLTELEKAKIPCGAINDIEQVFEHPQVIHRQLNISLPHDEAKQVDLVANPINFSKTKINYHKPPPMLGQHSAEILKEWLELDASVLEELVQSGVVSLNQIDQ